MKLTSAERLGEDVGHLACGHDVVNRYRLFLHEFPKEGDFSGHVLEFLGRYVTFGEHHC